MNIESQQLARLLSCLGQSKSRSISSGMFAAQLNIDESEVSGLVEAVRKYGIQFGKKDGNYFLVEWPDLLLPSFVLEELHTRSFGRRIHHYLQVDSTNNVAKKLAEDREEEGTLILAERQTSGRGRFSRKWFSDSEGGIFASLILRPQINVPDAPILSLAAAVAAYEGIESACRIQADIKWPNDLLYNGRKVCGILAEMKAEPEHLDYLILGIGINVNQGQFPSSLEDQATSLFLEEGSKHSRIKVLCRFLEAFERNYTDVEGGRKAAILERWTHHSSYAFGKWVQAIGGESHIIGRTVGLSEKGALRIQVSSGAIEEVSSGEVLAWR